MQHEVCPISPGIKANSRFQFKKAKLGMLMLAQRTMNTHK